MHRNLAALADETYDMLVIGGGIFGAGIARDASMRRLAVALVDKLDFASGTSSQSSKLIHGGFRYLEQYDFRLVAESCRERRILRRIAPHRVKPLPLLLPVYEGDSRPLWLLRLGMTLYDILALYRNVESHQALAPYRASMLEPELDRINLRGAIRFFDCQEDDARFCIDNLIDADLHGATCANYCEVIGFEESGGSLTTARAIDRITGQEFLIRAKVFINAAGPWVEEVARLTPHAGQAPRLSPTKGVHILLPKITHSHGIFFQGRQDGRMMFVLPWHDCTMVGTTDTDFFDNPADARADTADIEYLLREAQFLFPDRSITTSDVITTFAGVRPLLKSDSANPSARSRDHQILRSGENLLSIAGGKYTTYRRIAQQAVDEAYRLLGSHSPRCETAQTRIPNLTPAPTGIKLADAPEIYAGDIEHAVREEMAMTVEDVMRRRTGLALSRFGGIDIARRVADIMSPLIGWDDRQKEQSIEAYRLAMHSK